MTGTPLARGIPPYPLSTLPATPRPAQPLTQTRTLQAEAAGVHFVVHAAFPGHDSLAITHPDGMRVTIPMPVGALAALHQLLGEALGLPTTKGGTP
jgi:hypothetical protein